MQDFFEKWKEDKRFRTKVKLITYTLFVVIVSIYAFSLEPSNTASLDDVANVYKDTKEEPVITEDIIKIPEQYNYDIKVTIDNDIYQYTGKKTYEETTITKEINNKITNYIYKDNDYYIYEDGMYVKTTKEEVYDVVNSNYINLANINTYLTKAEKNNNKYLVYLKDVVLGNDSSEYFTVELNNNEINIDYTPLIKLFNQNTVKYNVEIKIDEIE